MSIAIKLAAKVRARRGDMTLREAESDSGIPFSTLRRAEAKKLPNVLTLARIIKWANIDAGKLFAGDE